MANTRSTSTIGLCVAVSVDDIGMDTVERLLQILVVDSQTHDDHYEWLLSCQTYGWSYHNVDPTNYQIVSTEPILYESLLEHDVVVAWHDGNEYILIHRREWTVVPHLSNEQLNRASGKHDAVATVVHADVAWDFRANSGQGARAPGIVLDKRSALALKELGRMHRTPIVVIIDDCMFGLFGITARMDPSHYQRQGFYIPGDYSVDDMRNAVLRLQ